MKQKWIIRASYPSTDEKYHWSDYAFSCLLKKQLEMQGAEVILEGRDEWYQDQNQDADVVIVLRGYLPYYRKRNENDCVYIMWNLSHPDSITVDEYNSYDMVCVASKPYAMQLKERVSSHVEVVPMCVDTQVFHPSDQKVEKIHDMIFVGNTRNVKRESVMFALEEKLPLEIWGDGWEQLIPEYQEHIKGNFVPNEKVPELYYQSKLTVNDHFEDMKEKGFMNTRILESLACGLPIMSDYSPCLEEVFGDSIVYYKNKEDYVKQYRYICEHYEEVEKRVQNAWPMIVEQFSFQATANKLMKLAEECNEKQYKGQIRDDLIVDLYRENQKIRLEKSDSVKKYRQAIAQRDELKKELKTLKDVSIHVNNLKNKEWPEKEELKQFRYMIGKEKETVAYQWVCGKKSETIPKVSIIIPVYNAEKYLAECFDSIRKQTLTDFEVLCIDDESDDESLHMLVAQAEKDCRYRVFKQKNAGPGGARNTGLINACGEYVFFMDADDCIKEHMLELCYETAMKYKSKVVYFDGEGFKGEDTVTNAFDHLLNFYKRKNEYPLTCSGADMLAKMRQNNEYRVNVYLQFINRGFLLEHGIRFVNGVIHEDQGFSAAVALRASKVSYIPETLYLRRIHDDSIMTGASPLLHVYGYYRMFWEIFPYMNEEFDDSIKNEIWSILKGIRRNICDYYDKLSEKEKNLFETLDEFEKERFYHTLAGPRRRAHVIKPEELAVYKEKAKELEVKKKELEKIKKSKAYQMALKMASPVRKIRRMMK